MVGNGESDHQQEETRRISKVGIIPEEEECDIVHLKTCLGCISTNR
jgi:hypothetical protein